MDTKEKTQEIDLVHAPTQALSVRSTALVQRGLRDLSRSSNWLIKKVFSTCASHLAMSPAGQACALSAIAEDGERRLEVYDVNEPGATLLTIPLAGGLDGPAKDSSASFAWSPTGEHFVASLDAARPGLQLFNLLSGISPKRFGNSGAIPGFLAWSNNGTFLAAASPGGNSAALSIWKIPPEGLPFPDYPQGSIAALEEFERQPSESESGEDGTFSGYGRMAFSPNEKSLAVVSEFKGEWADDSILVASLPSLRERSIFQAQGHITDLSWVHESQEIIYCTGGQAYRLSIGAKSSEALSFPAELCACHPYLPICVCYSSWLKNSARGKLCIFDLIRREIFDECAAEGIMALRWSGDGSKAYAMTLDGLAYIYESPLF